MAPPLLLLGANTNLGKSIFSAGLALAMARVVAHNNAAAAASSSSSHVARQIHPDFARKTGICYVKPVQTGPEKDENKIRRAMRGSGFAVPSASSSSPSPKTVAIDLKLKTLYYYAIAASPHLAASHDAVRPRESVASSSPPRVVFPTPKEILDSVVQAIENPTTHFNIIEGAGGVLSPTPDGSLQADVYADGDFLSGNEGTGVRGVNTILIGDANLGGISATLCAYEALASRTSYVAARNSSATDRSLKVVCLLTDDETEARHGNYEYLKSYLEKRGVATFRTSRRPPSASRSLKEFFRVTASEFDDVLRRAMA